MNKIAIRILILILIIISGCIVIRNDISLPDNQKGTGTGMSLFKINTDEFRVDIKWSPPQVANAYYKDYSHQGLTYQDDHGQDEQIRTREPEIYIDAINAKLTNIQRKLSIDRQEKINPRNEQLSALYEFARTSPYQYLGINFYNDAFLSVDYYFTNGVKFDYIHPGLEYSPFEIFMLPYRQNSVNYHGITIVQNMYTPTILDTTIVLKGDRPFAGYLYAGQYKISINPEKHFKQYSELDIGIIGPNSMGSSVQTTIHETKPVGWINQIKNDIIINYNFSFEKGFINTSHFELNGLLTGKVGTLYDNIGLGFSSRIGKLSPYFEDIGLSRTSLKNSKQKNIQYGFIVSSIIHYVGYDATLQGGILNKTSIYIFEPDQIERLTFTGSLGLIFTYNNFGLRSEFFYITPEFKGGKDHKWVQIGTIFRF